MSDAAPMFDPLPPEDTEAARGAESRDQSKPCPIVPVPDDAPPMQIRHPEHDEPTQSWPYHNAQGQLVGYICRWNFTNDEGEQDKLFWPVTYCDLGNGRKKWAAKGFPEPRPLYRQPEIAANPHARVLIVEGEKTADAASILLVR